jgi:hypothetical protein
MTAKGRGLRSAPTSPPVPIMNKPADSTQRVFLLLLRGAAASHAPAPIGRPIAARESRTPQRLSQGRLEGRRYRAPRLGVAGFSSIGTTGAGAC